MNKPIQIPACGFCRNYKWKAGVTDSGRCDVKQSDVAPNDEVCKEYVCLYNEEEIKQYVDFMNLLSEVDNRSEDYYTTDVFGNNTYDYDPRF